MPRSEETRPHLLALRPLALECLAVFALAALFHALLEVFLWPGLGGFDGWYHVKIAELYWTGDVPILGGDFPWQRFSRYNDLRHDWHLGYHVLLIPFTAFGLVAGGKASVVVFGAALSTSAYWVVRRSGLVAPLAWLLVTLLAVAASSQVLRVHFPRPTTPMIATLLVLIYFCANRRTLAVFVCATFLLYLYNVPHTIVLLAGVTAFVSAVRERRVAWATLGALAGAIALTTIVHPGFWTWEGSFFGLEHGNFSVWSQMAGTVQSARDHFRVAIDDQWVSMPVGVEFKPPVAAALVQIFLVPAVLPLLVVMLAGYRRRLSTAAALYLILASGYFVLFLEFIRFTEYWLPLAFVGAGCLLARCTDDVPWAEWNASARRLRQAFALAALASAGVQLGALALVEPISEPGAWLPTLVAVACLMARAIAGPTVHFLGKLELGAVQRVALCAAALGLLAVWMQHTAYQMQLLFSQGRRVALDVRARELVEPARWLKENAEPGELVYHDTWDAFPFLFFYSPESHYLVGFDPYFFYQHDPYRFRDWTLATAARLSLADTQAHLRAMGARYVLATKLRPGFRLHMDRMREAQPVYTSDFATLYRMGPPAVPASRDP